MKHLTLIRYILPLCLSGTAAWADQGLDQDLNYDGMKVDKVTVVKTTRSVYDGSPINAEVSELKSSVQSVDAAISDLDGKIEGNKLYIQLSADVLFDFDKAVIKPAAAKALSKVALIIEEKAQGPVTIIGHTDSKGKEAYNQDLSLRRAKATKNWLAGKTAATYQVEGKGESQPVADNTKLDGSDNPEGRAKNRRVDIIIQVEQGH